MRPTLWRSIAAASALLAVLSTAALLEAARRPRYGGELRVEMRASLRALDPSEIPDDPVALAAQRLWLPAVFETLVRLDDHGQPQPWLATAWVHDTARKSWIFTARKDVKFHDGTLWSPAAGSIAFPDDRPIEQILRELAGARNAITLRTAEGTLLGTGPYRIATWDAGKSAAFAAHDSYWGGRPYLDSIRLQMARNLTDQVNDFQIDKADVVEIALRDLRAAKQRGTLTSETPPMETVALVFENGRENSRIVPNVRRALALAIDRASIHNVLLQKQGEISGALLPRWLSGYAFLFPAERDVAKAKQIAPQVAPLNFIYDRDDPVIRPIGERIAVNAMEAGLTLRQTNPADVRLIRLPITAGDPWLALQDLASVLRLPLPATSASPYEIEKAMLESSGVIPLFHLPRGWLLRSRVHSWPRFEDIWLDPGATP